MRSGSRSACGDIRPACRVTRISGRGRMAPRAKLRIRSPLMNREALWSGRQDPCSSKEVRHRPAQSAEPRGRRVSARYEHQVPTALRRVRRTASLSLRFVLFRTTAFPTRLPTEKPTRLTSRWLRRATSTSHRSDHVRPCRPGRSEVAGPPEACVPGHQPTGANLHEQTSYSKPGSAL